jgi:hypothetical protein
MKTSRDIKFIIYQVLYLFVICVIALKGADINLDEVLDTKLAVKKSIADSLSKYIDSLLALKLSDSSANVDIAELIKGMKYEISNKIITSTVVPFVQPDNKTNYQSVPEKEKPKEEEKNLNEPTSKVVGPELTQFTISPITNPYNGTLDIFADGIKVASIPPKSRALVQLAGQKQIKYQVGEQFDIKSTKENKIPQISITRIGSSGENVPLRTVQSTTGFRVEIIDDFPGQLDIKFDGPVKVVQSGPTTFDVTLNFLSSENAFDSWSKDKDSPYKVSFFVNVQDKLNPAHKIKLGQTFVFGKW